MQLYERYNEALNILWSIDPILSKLFKGVNNSYIIQGSTNMKYQNSYNEKQQIAQHNRFLIFPANKGKQFCAHEAAN